jgi:hypothetical protein
MRTRAQFLRLPDGPQTDDMAKSITARIGELERRAAVASLNGLSQAEFVTILRATARDAEIAELRRAARCGVAENGPPPESGYVGRIIGGDEWPILMASPAGRQEAADRLRAAARRRQDRIARERFGAEKTDQFWRYCEDRQPTELPKPQA